MDNSKLILNPSVIPNLATLFVRGMDTVGDSIAFFRGGVKAVEDPSFPTHAGLATWHDKQLFVTEETGNGLVENSISEYVGRKNIRIVAMYYWLGWNDPNKTAEAMENLAWIRQQQGIKGTSVGKYNWWGLGRWVPVVRWLPWVKEAETSQAQWCSENCASTHKNAGASWIGDVHQAPDELMLTMQNREKTAGDVQCIPNYYQY